MMVKDPFYTLLHKPKTNSNMPHTQISKSTLTIANQTRTNPRILSQTSTQKPSTQTPNQNSKINKIGTRKDNKYLGKSQYSTNNQTGDEMKQGFPH